MTPDERIEEARRLGSVELNLSGNQLTAIPDVSPSSPTSRPSIWVATCFGFAHGIIGLCSRVESHSMPR